MTEQRPTGITPSLRVFLPVLLLAFLFECISIFRSLGGPSASFWSTNQARSIDQDWLPGVWLPELPKKNRVEYRGVRINDLHDDSAVQRGAKKGQKMQSGDQKILSRGRRKDDAPSETTMDQSNDQSIIQRQQQQEQTDTNRVYCMVPFIWTPSALETYHAIRESWGRRCAILRFFIDPIIGDDAVGFYNMTEASSVLKAHNAGMKLPNDVVILHDMKRPWHTCNSEENKAKGKPIGNCRNIFEKVWRMIVFVARGTGGVHVGQNRETIVTDAKTDADRAEWFVKVDADTFLFPENVGPHVQRMEYSYNDPHYFGHVLNHRKSDRGVPIVAGGAVFFSRAALLAASNAFTTMPMDKGNQEEDGTCRDSYTGTEEVVTAVCLKKFGITAEPAIDSEGREQVSLYEIDDILTYNRTDQGEWWFWEGKQKYPCHDTGDCLSHLPLAFHHYKDPQFFLDFEKEFYGSIATGKHDQTLHRRNDGKLAARAWNRFDRVHAYLERIRAAMKNTLENGDVQLDQRQLTPQQSPSLDNRLYCMVPFIWTPRYIPSYYTIHKTWGQRCDVLRFMIDPIIGDKESGFIDLRTNKTQAALLPEDVIVIYDIKRDWHKCKPKDENCRNIWEKIWRAWVWVDSHGESLLAEWFVKIDADSYLFPENLKHYVKEKGWSPDENHYFGHILRHRLTDAVPMIAGAAVFFSRATLKGAATIFRKFDKKITKAGKLEDGNWGGVQCQDAFTDQEEVRTSVCLKEYLGVDADPALDESGQELVIAGEIEDVLLWNRTEQGEWWYWQNKPYPSPARPRLHQCCGELPIAWHGYKNPQWMHKIENEFYSVDVSEVGEKLVFRNAEIANKYFDRVRKAMKKSSLS